MTLWWLQPGWKSANCERCGANIWRSGGDPDHGVCHDCFFRQRSEPPREEPPLCDICRKHKSVTAHRGHYVCSEACLWGADGTQGSDVRELDRTHDKRGNCFESALVFGCDKCGHGNLCDVCHKHDQPRGDCDECPLCPLCEAAKGPGSC